MSSPSRETPPIEFGSGSNTPLRPRKTITASPTSSIWRDLPESLFRQHVVELEKSTNAVPADAETFPLPDAPEADATRETGTSFKAHTNQISASKGTCDAFRDSDSPYEHLQPRQLTLATEQRLADDIAYLIAVGEGAQSVAATTVQEHRARHRVEGQQQDAGLRIVIASVDAIQPSLQAFLSSIFQLLSATSPTKKACCLLDLVVRHHQARLLNRLRSAKWKKPVYLFRTHKKPLYADFANLVHRVQFLYTKKEAAARAQLERGLSSLGNLLEAFESETNDHEKLVEIVRSSYELCNSPFVADYLERLQAGRATGQIQACLKTLRQIEKIAAYYRICVTLRSLSHSHAQTFDNVQLLFLPPFEAVPLTLAYQPWAKFTHVHAEIILAVHHDLENSDGSWYRPRCLGASKYFCYLCFLFIRHHGAYFAANTHGACYDQWTIPDLADYPESVAKHYRQVLRAMDADILAQTRDAVWRPEPMTSRENLIGATGI
ncbi:hypothetical protein CGRA01v4_06144 [Colletotrichum graminicola]|uniref:Uncharacterized protein n=1 Tax=Colletotrichum graminicola (strain M1.001 / M2 / FGSC 10212) TaxID=645133 RepID=E3R157_COLGM|nr:uncharacterized protein GLRG_11992 [Colletotrichum graminicola M1.001]EFQ36845.1 hypothetical protein GLRG_11992 [Colletotrichum graminicola M1.001]WDK14863.1 hypothetical protein CGRA01v4_06144 [Colletotrichum graminicola]